MNANQRTVHVQIRDHGNCCALHLQEEKELFCSSKYQDDNKSPQHQQKKNYQYLSHISRYEHDTDKTLAQVRFVSLISQRVIGIINWFAVHPTSMNNTNRLISSDNVGYASLLMEKALNGKTTLPGKVSLIF